MGSGLQPALPGLRPGHGYLTRFRVCSAPRPPEGGTPCSDSLSLRLRPIGLKPATRNNSPAHSSIGTPSPGQAGLRLLGGARFQGLFTPLPGCFPPFPHGTVHYRSPGVVRLGGRSPPLPAGFPVPGGTREHDHPRRGPFAYGALTPCGRPSQAVRLRPAPRAGPGRVPHRVPQPRRRNGCRLGTASVWAKPVSLTTTPGLAVASSSSGY
jgi:hypothetical protein